MPEKAVVCCCCCCCWPKAGVAVAPKSPVLWVDVVPPNKDVPPAPPKPVLWKPAAAPAGLLKEFWPNGVTPALVCVVPNPPRNSRILDFEPKLFSCYVPKVDVDGAEPNACLLNIFRRS
jgi:hypothetical protein